MRNLVAPPFLVACLLALHPSLARTEEPFAPAQSSPFVEVTMANVPGVAESTVSWGDYDNDGLLDFLLTGQDDWGQGISPLWHNTGTNFESVSVPGLHGVYFGDAVWCDYNNDGRLDFLITGLTDDPSAMTELWRNTGSGFAQVIVPGLPQVYNSSAAWGDYDNDGLSDFLLIGWNGMTPSSAITQLWRNTGEGFKRIMIGDAPGVYDGSIAWGDYNNDGRLDFIMTGVAASQAGLSLLWRNSGNGFEYIPIFGLPGVEAGGAVWGDADNDGWLDFLITGMSQSGPITKLWLNTSFGFSEVHVDGLPQVFLSHASWGDYDHDGLLDFFITGRTTLIDPVAQLWRNTGEDFTPVSIDGLSPVDVGAIAWADFDNDNRLDFAITGLDSSDMRNFHLWRNELSCSNSPPTAPDDLRMQTHGSHSVTLQWHAALDAQAPVEALGYNLVLSTTPTNSDLFSPLADLQNGFRRVVQLAPIRGGDNHTVWYTFTNLPPAPMYYWSVQAIDGSYAGSRFSTNASFPIGAPFFNQLHFESGNFQLAFYAAPNTYHVEGIVHLLEGNQGSWTELGVASTNAPGSYSFTDMGAVGHPFRLYRLRTP